MKYMSQRQCKERNQAMCVAFTRIRGSKISSSKLQSVHEPPETANGMGRRRNTLNHSENGPQG